MTCEWIDKMSSPAVILDANCWIASRTATAISHIGPYADSFNGDVVFGRALISYHDLLDFSICKLV